MCEHVFLVNYVNQTEMQRTINAHNNSIPIIHEIQRRDCKMWNVETCKATLLQQPDCGHSPALGLTTGGVINEDLLSFTHNWQIGLVCRAV